MKQQVNLYQPRVRKPGPLLSSTRAVVLVAGLAVLLGAWFAVRYVQLRGLESRLQSVEMQRQAESRRVADYRRRYPPKHKSAQLQNKLATRERVLHTRQRVLAMLESGEVGNTQGFSAYLAALARQRVEGTWLTGFTLANGGRAVSLSGSTVEPDLVPAYIRNLTLEDVFRGLSFEQMELRRADEAPRRIDFRLWSPGIPETAARGGHANG